MQRRMTVTLRALLVGLVLTTPPAIAASDQYEMSVFEGFASAHALLAGNAERALSLTERQQGSTRLFNRMANQTTRCVALTKTGQLDAAGASCDLAVENAQQLKPFMLRRYGMSPEFLGVVLETVERNQAVHREVTAAIQR